MPFILVSLSILLTLLALLSIYRLLRASANREEPQNILIEELSGLLTPLHSQLDQIIQELSDQKTLVGSNQLLRGVHHLLKDVAKVNDVDNLLSILLKQHQQQQALKVGIDKILANITVQQHSFSSIAMIAQRIDRILSGAQSKGAFGEQMVERLLAQLPSEWVARNIRFPNGKIVEFGLRAPNGRLVPIDSKWTATELLDQLGQTKDKVQQTILIKEINREVINRAKEVLKYLDKHRTIGFCIAAVPDPVFEHCLAIQPQLVKSNIVLISYSLLVPYILILVKLFLSTSQATQALQVSHVMTRSLLHIEQIQQLIDTQVRHPLDAVRLQQSQYNSYNQQLQASYSKLHQIQSELDEVQRSMPSVIDTLSNTDVAAIPNTLQHQLAQLRESLLESTYQKISHSSDKNSTQQNDVEQRHAE